jgi:hypothetical protein
MPGEHYVVVKNNATLTDGVAHVRQVGSMAPLTKYGLGEAATALAVTQNTSVSSDYMDLSDIDWSQATMMLESSAGDVTVLATLSTDGGNVPEQAAVAITAFATKTVGTYSAALSVLPYAHFVKFTLTENNTAATSVRFVIMGKSLVIDPEE